MKVFYTAVLIICLNVGLGILAEADIFDVTLVNDKAMLNKITDSYSGLAEYSKPLEEDSQYDFGDSDSTDRGISLWTTIKHCFLPHALLIDVFHIDYTVAILISCPIYLFYLIGLAQLFINIGGKSAI